MVLSNLAQLWLTLFPSVPSVFVIPLSSVPCEPVILTLTLVLFLVVCSYVSGSKLSNCSELCVLHLKPCLAGLFLEVKEVTRVKVLNL